MGQLATLDVGDAVAVLTLNAPQQYNTFDEPMLRCLLSLVGRIECDATVRSVVLTGAGSVFSAGGRLDGFQEPADLPRRLRTLIDLAHDLVRLIAALPVPIVVAVNGVTAGGAIGLVLAGDYVIAADTATFRTAYAAIGRRCRGDEALGRGGGRAPGAQSPSDQPHFHRRRSSGLGHGR